MFFTIKGTDDDNDDGFDYDDNDDNNYDYKSTLISV